MTEKIKNMFKDRKRVTTLGAVVVVVLLVGYGVYAKVHGGTTPQIEVRSTSAGAAPIGTFPGTTAGTVSDIKAGSYALVVGEDQDTGIVLARAVILGSSTSTLSSLTSFGGRGTATSSVGGGAVAQGQMANGTASSTRSSRGEQFANMTDAQRQAFIAQRQAQGGATGGSASGSGSGFAGARTVTGSRTSFATAARYTGKVSSVDGDMVTLTLDDGSSVLVLLPQHVSVMVAK
jgi:hypothetical protein